MTRKDYVKLATALREAYQRAQNVAKAPGAMAAVKPGLAFGVQLATECIVEALAADNPHFDGARFWAAVEKGTA